MRVFYRLAIALVLCFSLQASSRAAPDPSAARHLPASETAEVMVFVADNCTYCAVFRRDIMPAYERSGRAKFAPMRFVDVNQADWSGLGLSGPITIVPTTVVVVAGREVARVPGYTGPRMFFRVINRALSQPN